MSGLNVEVALKMALKIRNLKVKECTILCHVVNGVNFATCIQVELTGFIHFDSPLLLVLSSTTFSHTSKQVALIDCIDMGEITA